jgi:hypothetical protein
MREAFVHKRFGNDAVAMINTIIDILDAYEAQGYDLSLRQLYYQLVARNIVPNTERSYKNVGNLVSDARLAGLIDWDMIKDRGRVMVSNSHWDNPADIVRTAAHSFRIDRWADQPKYVEVMVEKQALEGVLVPVCSELDVPFTANKGYSSSSAMYEASKRFIRRGEDDKKLYVIYLGDHDPSGIDMSRDVLDRMALFVNGRRDLGQEVTVQRIALNMDQVRELRPPENPAKITDSRAESYIQRFGRSSWELDAIEPAALATLVRNAITKLIDKTLWAASGSKQQGMRYELLEYADNYGRNGK